MAKLQVQRPVQGRVAATNSQKNQNTHQEYKSILVAELQAQRPMHFTARYSCCIVNHVQENARKKFTSRSDIVGSENSVTMPSHVAC